MTALERLAATIDSRRGADPSSSWTAQLLAKGPEKCAEKFGEEAVEAVIAAVKGDRDELISEAEARAAKDWAAADAIRDSLTAAGIVIEDSAEGARWSLA